MPRKGWLVLLVLSLTLLGCAMPSALSELVDPTGTAEPVPTAVQAPTGVLTPKYHALVEKQYDKFKYCFRIHGEAVNLVGEIFANFGELKEKYGFNNLFIIAQDVAHARGAGEIIKNPSTFSLSNQ